MVRYAKKSIFPLGGIKCLNLALDHGVTNAAVPTAHTTGKNRGEVEKIKNK